MSRFTPSGDRLKGGFAKPLKLRLLSSSSALKLGRWERAKVLLASAPCIANQVVVRVAEIGLGETELQAAAAHGAIGPE
jgi:hypothetical protein